MSGAAAMFDPIKATLATAVHSVVAGAPISIGQPQTWAPGTACLAYFWYDDTVGVPLAGPSVIRYTHKFILHALVRNTAGLDEAAERAMEALDTAIYDAFMNNRRLTATAATSTIKQGDGKQQTGPIYITHERAEYRHRFWTLEACEDRTYNFVLG